MSMIRDMDIVSFNKWHSITNYPLWHRTAYILCIISVTQITHIPHITYIPHTSHMTSITHILHGAHCKPEFIISLPCNLPWLPSSDLSSSFSPGTLALTWPPWLSSSQPSSAPALTLCSNSWKTYAWQSGRTRPLPLPHTRDIELPHLTHMQTSLQHRKKGATSETRSLSTNPASMRYVTYCTLQLCTTLGQK